LMAMQVTSVSMTTEDWRHYAAATNARREEDDNSSRCFPELGTKQHCYN